MSQSQTMINAEVADYRVKVILCTDPRFCIRYAPGPRYLLARHVEIPCPGIGKPKVSIQAKVGSLKFPMTI